MSLCLGHVNKGSSFTGCRRGCLGAVQLEKQLQQPPPAEELPQLSPSPSSAANKKERKRDPVSPFSPFNRAKRKYPSAFVSPFRLLESHSFEIFVMEWQVSTSPQHCLGGFPLGRAEGRKEQKMSLISKRGNILWEWVGLLR